MRLKVFLLKLVYIFFIRWALNLVLRTLDKMMMVNSTMDSEDLTEADKESITAFMCYLFMVLYKYRQCRIVVARYVIKLYMPESIMMIVVLFQCLRKNLIN